MNYLSARAVDLEAKSRQAFEITISRNPAKVRALLNIWFAADFKPTFVPDRAQDLGGFDDVELLGASTAETRVPMRMFDIDTKNLVDYPDVGALGQYCMLSHRWMDREVDYPFIANTKLLDFNRAMLDLNNDGRGKRQNDVELIKAQCEKEIQEHEETIKSLVSGCMDDLGLRNSPDIIGDLLSRRVKAKAAKNKQNEAEKEIDEGFRKDRYAKLEEGVFRDMMKEMGITEEDSSKIMKRVETEIESEEKPQIRKTPDQQTDQQTESDIEIFQHHGRIREAVDKMTSLLQQRKSAVKIEKSIEQAKEIFDKKLFPRGQKRYVWLDTCCINKSNDQEFTESLSLMGDWYANSDFTLVFLDNTSDSEQWVDEWKRFKTNGIQIPNIGSFRGIHGSNPEWSERGWTLQELVMSKMTYYANSTWEPLGRPIESIGPFYYLCPFIRIYCDGDKSNPYSEALDILENPETLAKILNDSGVENPYDQPEDHIMGAGLKKGETGQEPQLQTEKRAVEIAQKLIIILDILGVQIPKNIDMDTAKPQIAQSIHFASTKLASIDPPKAPFTLLATLKTTVEGCVSEKHRSSNLDLKRTKHLINVLLQCFVKVTEDLIKEDRKYIADFGNVQDLRTWQNGTARSGFSTHKVMSLACKRKCFRPTDRAYSLMGLLAVRYPVFHAEGLNKAMVRLLDEVVISSNDVSVFNWTGKHLGSSIRGRSLYPSTLEAYSTQKKEKRQMVMNKELAGMLQIKRYEFTEVYLSITTILQDTIMFIKNSKQKNLPILWLQEIIHVVKEKDYRTLKPHSENLGKILVWIQQTFAPPSIPEGGKDLALAKDVDMKTEEPANASNNSHLPFGIRSPVSYPSFDTSSFKPKFGNLVKKSEPESSAKSQPSRMGIGGFKSPMNVGFGKNRKIPEPSKSLQEVKELNPPPSPSPSTAETLINEPSPSEPSPSKPDPEALIRQWNDEVIKYIREIKPPKEDSATSIPVPGSTSSPEVQSTHKPAPSPTPEPRLPDEFQKVLNDIKVNAPVKSSTKPDEMETMISPNPIIVNSSGIEGVFDIQRVIVTMLQPEKLRRQIESAVTPTQKITGWCTISTGFALVMVGFCCEKRILEQELNVINVVEHKVLKEVKEEDEQKSRLMRRTTSHVESPKHVGSTPTPTSPPLGESLSPTSEAPKTTNDDEEPVDNEEAKRVSRMIKFVQEPNLNSIAGEWVLARISGVPGAKWFLCHLELGSTHNFYGHRIPTDEINFYDASPEMGLDKFWLTYMMRKKYKLCKIFEALLESKDSGNTIAQLAESFGDLVNSGGDADSDTESTGKTTPGFFDQKLAQDSISAAKKVGGEMVQWFWELKADIRERNLNAAVLKKIPVHLQAAVESLNENKDLLPAMFHSARRVHMF